MSVSTSKIGWFSGGLTVALLLSGLLAIARYNYLLFHSLVEIFSVIVAGSIFMVAWSTRQMRGNDYLLFLGISYLCTGGLDLLHTLAYKGMGVFPSSGANPAPQLWIATRTLESLSLLAAPLFLTRRLAFGPTLAGYALLTTALLAAIFVWPVFPVCYIEGVGLTPFKIASEYAIIALLLAALLFLLKKRQGLDQKILRLLCLAIACTAAAELAFTLYTASVTGPANITGHLLKLLSFFLVYLALVRKGIIEPTELIFKELSESAKILRLSEQKLREGEEKFRSIYEGSNDAIMLLTDKGFFDCNARTLEIFALPSKDAFVSLHPSQLSPPLQSDGRDSFSAANEKIATAFEQGWNRFEWTHRRKSGEDFPAEVLLSAFDYQGERVLQATVRDITETKNILQKFEASEKRYRMLFECAQDAIFILDVEGEKAGSIVAANQAAAEMHGYTIDEILSLSIADLDTPEAAQDVPGRFQRILNGEFIREEIPHRKKDGTIFLVEANAGLLELNKHKYAFAFDRDISERKKAENTLRASEESFRLIAETISEVFWIADVPIKRMFYVSPGYELVWGRSRQSLYENPQSFLDAVHPEDLPLVLAGYESKNRGEPFDHEYRIIRPDGTIRWIWGRGYPAPDEAGRVTRYVGAAQDITTRKQAEEKLRKGEKALRLSEQKFRSLVDNLGVGVTLISPNMEILSINQQMRKWFPNIDPARKPICYEAFNDPPREGICSYCPTHKTFKDGLVHVAITTTPAGAETRHYHIVAAPLKDETGRLIGVIESVDDITEFKRAEQKLAQYSERMTILHALDRDILAARDPKAIARAALVHLRHMVSCDGCCILLFDHERRVTVPLALLAEFVCPFQQDDTLAFQCESFMEKLKAGETVTVEDVTHPDRPCPVQEAMGRAGLLSFTAVPLMEKETLIGMLGLFAKDNNVFQPEHLELAREVAVPVAIALQWGRLLETLSRHRHQVQALASRLAKADQDLRQSLARELHDTIGQELSAMALQLNIVRHGLPPDSDPALDRRLEVASGIAAQTIEQVRTIMANLRPPVLDDCGLAAALRWEAQRVTERYGPALVVRVIADESPPTPGPEQEIVLFRVAQEAIMNAVKHAKATTITVTLRAEAGRLTLQVTDDGQGFTPGSEEHNWSRQGLGLINMRERALALGGRFSIDSQPGSGTTIKVEVNLP